MTGRRRRRQQVLGAALVLLWVGIWSASGLAPWDTAVLAAAALLLLLGTALIFVALVRIDLSSPGRRSAGAEVQRPEALPLPPRADVAHDPTAPPAAGGRALPGGPEERRLTFEERASWGRCPVCGAEPGAWCNAEVGLSLGLRADGRRLATGEGAHLARLERAPLRVATMVDVRLLGSGMGRTRKGCD